jgi:hypothetical protein
MMERSSRFISLSGLSGVSAGVIALIGSLYVYFVLQDAGVNYFDYSRKVYDFTLIKKLIIIALVIMVFAVLSAYFFTAQKSKKNKLPFWHPTTKRLLFNFALPLGVGGLFCFGLIYHELYALLSSATLIFYGLALVNAEKYTFSDIKYLGYCEIILGFISMFFLGHGLIVWAIGFGVLHIVYGFIMHFKYK